MYKTIYKRQLIIKIMVGGTTVHFTINIRKVGVLAAIFKCT